MRVSLSNIKIISHISFCLFILYSCKRNSGSDSEVEGDTNISKCQPIKDRSKIKTRIFETDKVYELYSHSNQANTIDLSRPFHNNVERPGPGPDENKFEKNLQFLNIVKVKKGCQFALGEANSQLMGKINILAYDAMDSKRYRWTVSINSLDMIDKSSFQQIDVSKNVGLSLFDLEPFPKESENWIDYARYYSSLFRFSFGSDAQVPPSVSVPEGKIPWHVHKENYFESNGEVTQQWLLYFPLVDLYNIKKTSYSGTPTSPKLISKFIENQSKWPTCSRRGMDECVSYMVAELAEMYETYVAYNSPILTWIRKQLNIPKTTRPKIAGPEFIELKNFLKVFSLLDDVSTVQTDAQLFEAIVAKMKTPQNYAKIKKYLKGLQLYEKQFLQRYFMTYQELDVPKEHVNFLTEPLGQAFVIEYCNSKSVFTDIKFEYGTWVCNKPNYRLRFHPIYWDEVCKEKFSGSIGAMRVKDSFNYRCYNYK